MSLAERLAPAKPKPEPKVSPWVKRALEGRLPAKVLAS